MAAGVDDVDDERVALYGGVWCCVVVVGLGEDGHVVCEGCVVVDEVVRGVVEPRGLVRYVSFTPCFLRRRVGARCDGDEGCEEEVQALVHYVLVSQLILCGRPVAAGMSSLTMSCRGREALRLPCTVVGMMICCGARFVVSGVMCSELLVTVALCVVVRIGLGVSTVTLYDKVLFV